MEHQIYMVTPTYDGQIHQAHAESLKRAGKFVTQYSVGGSSFLGDTFNRLYCQGLNARKDGITHWLMVHADIIPEPGFADKMLSILNECKGGALSVVSPMKNPKGPKPDGGDLTSTAIDLGPDKKPAHLTLKQIWELPHGTFTNENILLNTGCLLVDLRQEWADKVHFDMKSWIEKREENFEAVSISEDWDWSRQVRKLGGTLYATRQVKLEHVSSQVVFKNWV